MHKYKDWNKRIIVIFITVLALSVFNIHYLLKKNIFLYADKYAKSTIIAPFEFYYEDKEATEKKLKEAISHLSPIYKLDLRNISNIEKNIEDLFNRVRDLKENNVSKVAGLRRLSQEFQDKIPQDYLSFLLDCQQLYSLEQDVKTLVNFWQRCGVSAVDEKKLRTDASSEKGIRLKIYSDTGFIEKYLKEEGIDKIFIPSSNNLVSVPEGLISPYKERAIGLARFFIQPNLEYLEKETEKEILRLKENILPVLKKVEKNEVIVKKGQEIDETTLMKLNVLSSLMTKTNKWRFLGYTFLILTTLSLLIILSSKICKELLLFTNLVFFSSLMIIMLIIAKIMQVCNLPLLVLPISAFSMVISIIISENAAVLTTIFLSWLLNLLIGIDEEIIFPLVVGAFAGIYTVGYTKVKADLINPGIVIGLSNSIVIIGFKSIKLQHMNNNLMWDLFCGSLVNGFLSIILSLIIIDLVERFGNITTNFRLFKLSDLNHPLLKELLIHAPGTYHHSLLVATLAEAACSACLANPILTRVGAYYHDIGKIARPYYFAENHLNGREFSKYLYTKPDLLTTIFKSHIKEGISLAKENKLSKKIVDIILQHHGTSKVLPYIKNVGYKTISHKKTQASGTEGEIEKIEKIEKIEEVEIVESPDYKEVKDVDIILSRERYEGPRPRTKEAALILLADTVELASRILEHPTATRIENLVKKIVYEKFNEHELDECDLTLRELDNIISIFTKNLITLSYSRIEPQLTEQNHLSLLDQKALQNKE